MVNYKEIKRKLLKKIEMLSRSELSKFKVLTMSDFILDHILFIDDFDYFLREVKRIYKQGGGDLPAIRQTIQRGGCSANTTSGLNALGINTYFIGRTNLLGKKLLELFLGDENVNIKNLKTNGNLGLMTIFEIGKEKINVMVGDPDSLSPLGYKDITSSDRKILHSCDLVGIFGWAMNRSGTDLAKGVFNLAKKVNILTYIDTADPSFKLEEIKDLFEYVISNKNLDILSINENELNYYSNFISTKASNLKILEKGVLLKKNISAKIDIHTSLYSASLDGDEVYIMPAFKANIKRSTGAGDMFNSGNILGYLLKLEPLERLQFANAMACCFISSNIPLPPNIKDIYNFINNTPFKPLKGEIVG